MSTGGCQPNVVCLRPTGALDGTTGTLLLNTQELTCKTRCDCNNQRYTGICKENKCEVILRESCTTKGAIRACKDTSSDNCSGYQICQPSHLYLQLWGDCRCDLDPENPTGEKAPLETSQDGSESSMGGEKQLVESQEPAPERQEPIPEPRPDTCPTEVCGDGIDNDCDGQVDEACTPCAPNKQLWSLQRAGLAAQHPWRPLLFSASGNDAQAWNLQTGKSLQMLTGHTKIIQALAVGAAGRRVATASDDGSVRIWDAQSLQQRLRITPYETGGTARPVVGVALHPQGKGFATIGSGTDGAVLWNDAGKQVSALAQQDKTLTARHLVHYSPDGTKLAVLGEEAGGKGVVLLWDLQATPPKYLGALTGLAGGKKVLAFHPGGLILATTSNTETLLWNLRDRKVAKTLSGATHAAAWSPDSRRLALAHDDDVAIWHLQESLLARIPTQVPFTALSFSGDGAQLSGTSGLPGNQTTTVWSCPCTQASSTGVCYSGAAGTTNKGVCQPGTWACDGSRRLPCTGMQPPTPEIPDGLDNNCDGTTDEGLVDLAVASLTLTPTRAPAATTRELRVCLDNIGDFTSRSDAVSVQIYLSTDAQITSADTTLTGGPQQPQMLRWTGLQGGQPPSCKTLSLDLSQAKAGSYFLGAIVDPDKRIPEADEANNTKSVSVEVE